MRLDIIIPHYKEPWDLCKYLFDTIATQRGVLFDNIRVIVVNDGDFVVLNEKLFEQYPFEVKYLVKEHGGVSAARNYGLDHSDADYVMFCDIDDGFLSNYGLHMMFSAMQEGLDTVCGSFIEETWDRDGSPIIVPHSRDLTFVHGKLYRRQFLVDNNLRFDPSLTIHEDGYFNMLTYAVATKVGKVKNIDTPFYIWRWNGDSTVRRDSTDFVLKTYDHVMRARIALCDELKKRDLMDEYEISVCMTVCNSYYDFQKPPYRTQANQKYVREAEKSFKRFFDRHGKAFLNATNQRVGEIAKAARDNACKNGLLMEQEDIRSFLKRIQYEVRA